MVYIVKPSIDMDLETLLSDLESISFYSQFINYKALGINKKKEQKKLKSLMKLVEKGKVEEYMEEGYQLPWT